MLVCVACPQWVLHVFSLCGMSSVCALSERGMSSVGVGWPRSALDVWHQ